MPVIEFASVIPLPGVSPTNEHLLGIANQTVTAMEGTGVKPVRFLLTAEDEKRTDQRIISMVAIWPSAETHAAFFASGGATDALGPLTQYITMGEAVFLPTETGQKELKLLASKEIASAIFRVKPQNIDEFETKVKSVLEKQDVVITAWDIREQGESFVASGTVTEQHLGARSGKIEGAKNWVLISENEGVIEEINESANGLFERADVLRWVDLID